MDIRSEGKEIILLYPENIKKMFTHEIEAT